jgi:hypothetical protein
VITEAGMSNAVVVGLPSCGDSSALKA